MLATLLLLLLPKPLPVLLLLGRVCRTHHALTHAKNRSPTTHRCRGNFVAGGHGALVTIGRRPIDPVADAAAAGWIGGCCGGGRLRCALRLLYVGYLMLHWSQMVSPCHRLTELSFFTHRQAVRWVPAVWLRGPIQQQSIVHWNQVRQRRGVCIRCAPCRSGCIVTGGCRGWVVCLAIALVVAHRTERIRPVDRTKY